MEEPKALPQPPKKTRFRTPKGTSVCGLSLSEWIHLLVPHLELVDIVHLSRTCRAFVGDKRFMSVITTKRKAAFCGLNQRHWNKLGDCKSMKNREELQTRHAGKFMLLIHRRRYGFRHSYQMAAYSTKQRLIDALTELKAQNSLHCDHDELSSYDSTIHPITFVRTLQEFTPDWWCVGLNQDEVEAIFPKHVW